MTVAAHALRCATMACLVVAGLVVPVLLASSALAEGRGGGTDLSIDQRGWLDFWDRAMNTRYPRHDRNFEEGRRIFLGQRGEPRLRFCLAKSPDAPREPLNRKALRNYRSISVTEFVKSLYDCNDPDAHVLQKLPPEEAGLVVYYLHKQYRLRLKQSPDAGSKARQVNR